MPQRPLDIRLKKDRRCIGSFEGMVGDKRYFTGCVSIDIEEGGGIQQGMTESRQGPLARFGRRHPVGSPTGIELDHGLLAAFHFGWRGDSIEDQLEGVADSDLPIAR
jgi:hypothetical protein